MEISQLDVLSGGQQFTCLTNLYMPYVQGGSDMTGTDLCVNKCRQSRSYLNHLVFVDRLS